MNTGYQIYDQHATYYLTLTVVDWVDVFTRLSYKNVVIDSLAYCVAHKGLEVYGYVIMTNHLHLIVRAGGSIGLSAIVRDFKKFASHTILKNIQDAPESRREWMLHRFGYNAAHHQRNSEYQFWQYGNHAIEILSREFFFEKLNYLHQNPVKAGIVAFAEDYLYSSACELSGRGSKLPVRHFYE